MKSGKWLLCCMLSASSLGCADMFPRFVGPGPAREQQRVFSRFDPYPDPTLGPEVVGGRPLGYQNPLSESEQAHAFLMSTRGRPPQAITPSAAVLPPPPPDVPIR